mmetsp:Transcript_74487/g.231111  ORF Transcript_74487/g.231111 Transcript_74487/m.231111 type:complete len:450 (-) Transcript_74487:89-1438(-)
MSLLSKAACSFALAALALGEPSATCSASEPVSVEEQSMMFMQMQTNLLTVKRGAAAGQKLDAYAKAEQQPTPSIVYGDAATNSCPSGYDRIVNEAECRAAMPLLDGGDPDGYNGNSGAESNWPTGCYSCNNQAWGCSNGVWFNPHPTGAQHQGARPLCKQNFAIQTGQTLFVGDSDIDYWHTSGTAVPGSYNVGIGGNTCNDVQQEIDFLLQSFQPSWVVLICGENDLSYGTGVSQTFSRWRSIVEKIFASGAKVAMLGTKPERATQNLHSKYQQYDARIKGYAAADAARGAPARLFFVDSFEAFTAMGNPDSLYDPSEAPEYLHLGPNGYAHFDRWAALAMTNLFGCVIWEGDACKTQAPSIVAMTASVNECPGGYRKLTTAQECNAASGLIKLPSPRFQGSEDVAEWPGGCYYCGDDVAECSAGTWFNSNSGAAKQGARLLCMRLQA